ncbi:MAG: ABC transporter permease [Oscillospiraceae bacterium]|jgi:putative ABC transport system permease protein|nr:ABC transporter permease [Oscillospiraceae bacterium]
MSAREIITLLELGLAYAILSMGVFVTFRVLDTPDLTTEGSFTLGAAVSAALALGGHPALGLLLGFAAGALAGLCTALLMTRGRVQPILTGILVMTGLYSVNLFVMGGKSNLPLMRVDTVFTPMEALVPGGWHRVALLALLVSLLGVGLCVFFRSSLGLSVRATGDNERMVRASSISTDVTKAVALCLANGLCALSGAVVAQAQQFTDISMGMGTVLVALASLILGETLLRGGGIPRGMLSAVVGSVLYRAIVALVLKTSIPAYAVKLMTALLVAAAVLQPTLARALTLARAKRKEARRHAAH